MDAEEFKSDLGKVAVTKSHIERIRNEESDDWERIERHFSDRKLVDHVHFEEIEDLKFEDGSIYPNIRIKVDGDWKRFFFHVGDEAEECFKELEYRIKAYKQVFS